MSVRYDPFVIQAFADALYRRARGMVLSYTAAGVLIPAFLYLLRDSPSSQAHLPILLVTCSVTGALGFLFGSQRAFALKLQAQTALCQIRIEENTRLRQVSERHDF